MAERVAFERDGLTVRGYLALPEGPQAPDAPYPLVICAHGFGGNGQRGLPLAERISQRGVAVCAFSFCGCRESESDGSPLDRSVLTEAADLHAVLAGLAARPDIDEGRIALMGMSEGGFVSTLVAASQPHAVRALALLYPAYCIPDDARARLAAQPAEETPAPAEIRGVVVGRRYSEDAAKTDVFAAMPRYDGPVCIVHGIADSLVPIEYSRRAARAFPHAQLVEVEGAEHGMRHEFGPQMAQIATDFLVSQLCDAATAAE